MAEKQDHLATCNELGVPIRDFEMQFCARCLQVECTRSQHGKSRFEQRIGTWRERLFEEVPRMNDADPRMKDIRAKRFIDIDTGPIPEIGERHEWRDPRDLDAATESAQTVVEVPPTTSVVSTTPEPSPSPSVVPVATQLMNTSTQPGRMLGGRKLKPKDDADPWAVKPQETQGLQVVKPGARIKIGGSGV